MSNLINCISTDSMQNEQTIDFVRRAKALLYQGIIKRKLDLAAHLDMGDTTLSNILNGRKNITPAAYKIFTELYPREVEDLDYQKQLTENLSQQVADLRTTLAHERERAQTVMAHLERQVQLLTRENEDLRRNLELSSGKIREYMIINREYLKSLYRNVVQVRAKLQEPTAEFQLSEDTLLAAGIRESLQKGNNSQKGTTDNG